MILIVCLDENGGMAFNRRRQTRDAEQRRHLQTRLKGKTLWMNEYSAKLYQKEMTDVVCKSLKSITEVQDLKAKDYVLVETENVEAIVDRFDEIWVYHWNRSYPDDVVFPMNKLKEYRMCESEEFRGTSHDVIRFEVYRK